VVGSVSKKFQAMLNPESAAKLAKGGFSYTGQLEVPAGEYNVTFAIRDNVTGRIGSLQAALKVE